jgi:RHS repeat-associated protein
MTLTYPVDIFGQRTGTFAQWPSQNWTGWNVYWSQVAGQRLNMGGASAYIDHADATGSTTMETDPAGGVQWKIAYYPWGQVLAQGGIRQSVVWAGLDWQINDPSIPSATRELSPALGRWLTPDPGNAGADPSNPQSWNAYAYALNNPTTLNDPEGTDVRVCLNNENGGQDCQWYSDAEYNKYAAAQNASYQGINAPVGDASNLGHPSGNITCGSSVCGTVTYGEAPSQDVTGGLVNLGLLVAGGANLVRGAAGAVEAGIGGIRSLIVGSGAPAVQTLGLSEIGAATEDEILGRAVGVVGNRSIRATSHEAAEAAADRFLGAGWRPITDRATGEITGEISADGQRVVRLTSAGKSGPYINLENKVTGGNLHVYYPN